MRISIVTSCQALRELIGLLSRADQHKAVRHLWQAIAALYGLMGFLEPLTDAALTPYRAIDPAAVKAALTGKSRDFKFVAAQWAELTPCALTGEWKSTQFNASADASACSALLPGLGESASLLPLRFT